MIVCVTEPHSPPGVYRAEVCVKGRGCAKHTGNKVSNNEEKILYLL